MSGVVVLDLHYLPCLDYVAALLQHERVLIEAAESFQKQSYRNRCYIRQTNQRMLLSVPTQRTQRGMPIREVRVQTGGDWQRIHIQSLQSAYGKAPFYAHYAPAILDILTDPPPLLFDLNKRLLTTCLHLMGAMPQIDYTQQFIVHYPEPVMDLRQAISPKRPDIFAHRPYWQVFGDSFMTNLSIVDALFCLGPEAITYLKGSTSNKTR
ncbi:MAG: WbqC family protein [Bernardetiaceae bacterium]